MLTLWAYLQSRTTEREEGVVALEYVILAAAIILAVTAGVAIFGPKLTAKIGGLLP